MAQDKEQKKIGDVHPLGHLLDDWAEWVQNEGEGNLIIEYDEDDDSFLVTRNKRKAVLYTSDIDARFYGEGQALFVEAEVGIPPKNLDWNQSLKFSGNELVLARISLSPRDEHDVLLVEGAFPLSKIDFSLFDLLVREVATIARDLRRLLRGKLQKAAGTDEEEDDEDEI